MQRVVGTKGSLSDFRPALFAESEDFVAGDADATPEAEAIKCDVALLPCGGKYTMNEEEAAALANRIKPRAAIPTHYGAVAGDKGSGGRFCALLDKSIRGLDIMGTETEI